MLPEGYKGLILANHRRSLEWQSGLRAAGMDVVRVPAVGKDSEKGSWQIGVAASDEVRARRFVSDVIRKQIELPSVPALSPLGMRALVGVGVIVGLLVAVFLMAH